jgi:heat shock protein HtpX
MDNLFATHPSTDNRIAALRQLAAQMGVGRFDRPRTAPNYPAQGWGPWGNASQRGAETGRRGPWG